MKRGFTIMYIVLCVFACNSDKNSKTNDIGKNNSSPIELFERDTLPNGYIKLRPYYSLTKFDTGTIKLEFFDTIPETISNPAEFFTYDTTKLADKKFIFLTNLAEYGIVRNNGKEIYLAKDHKNCIAVSENTFKDVFSGNGFTVTLTTKVINHNNGVSYENGILEIKNSHHQSSYNIHGGYRIL